MKERLQALLGIKTPRAGICLKMIEFTCLFTFTLLLKHMSINLQGSKGQSSLWEVK